MNLTESEWRMIHNALSVYQTWNTQGAPTDRAYQRRADIQQVMDKIRDNFIVKAKFGLLPASGDFVQ